MKKIMVILIAFLPITGKLRIWLYRILYHGKIGKNCRAGYGTRIQVRELDLGDHVILGNMVRIKNLDCLHIGNNTEIRSNTMFCGSDTQFKVAERNVFIGEKCHIMSRHYFDVVCPITIGNEVVFAGRYSEVYTHSFDYKNDMLMGEVIIGNQVYIGTRCIINLGTTIIDKVVLQAGTVASGEIAQSGVYGSQCFRKTGNIHAYEELYQLVKRNGYFSCYHK